MPNKLSQFWHELKRRNVVRVITVYTGAAFVILSLVDMIREPFELPNWSFKLVIVLLSAGLIIAVILSWIYDIHPEGGMVKTKPVGKSKPEDVPKSSGGWKIASYISFVVIVGLIVLNIITRSDHDRKDLEKSIAVLPLEYLSEDPGKEYLANGVLDAITGHLSLIEGLRVMPRTSVEQYRENKKSAKEIGEELDVSYLIEGSFQMVGDQVKLIIQLVDAAEGDHVFFREYDREYKDIFAVQSEVAKTIAREIEVVLTPEEIRRIEKVPTTSLTAYDYWLQGQEEIMKVLLGREYGSSLEQAAHYFKTALEYDPAYARAFAGLAMVSYYNNTSYTLSGGLQYTADELRSTNLDSMNLYANKALELDDRISDAYYVKGYYEQERGNLVEAMKFMKQAMDIDPNNTRAMIGASDILWSQYDFVGSLEMLQRASVLEGDPSQDMAVYLLAWEFWQMDLREPSEHYLNEYVSVAGDSLLYYTLKFYYEGQHGRFDEALPYAKAGYAIDTTDRDATLILGRAYLDLGQYKRAYPYYARYFSELENSGILDVNDMNRMGYVLWMLGKKEEAQQYFHEMIAQSKRHIRMNTIIGRQGASYDIAGVYAFLGEKDSAYHYLEMFKETNYQSAYIITMLKELDPLFEPIRQEERFRQLADQMEAKYQAERERVRQWLEEHDML
jgi:TolB-like protein/tetratricopeptide (TPR) repeat protein